MSTVIEEFPAQPMGRPPKYDWDKWTDGRVHVCKAGKDFSCTAPSFRALVHATARSLSKKAGKNIRAKANINKGGDKVTIVFFEA
jgi:hypothetical protein